MQLAAADLANDAPALAEALARAEPLAARDPAAIRVVRAPGRVNLIGEHTDYNTGFVLPVAIDLGMAIAFVPTDDRRVVLTSIATGDRATVDLDDLGSRTGTWTDYVAGTAWALAEAGAAIRGFRGVMAAELPIAAGLSSSAALELATAWALGGGAAPLADPMALARAAQRAENEHVGVACGLMDQFAVTFGVAGAALLLDCRSFEFRPVALPPGVELVVVHSGLPRRLVASEYAARRAECGDAVRQIRRVSPEVRSLRDVDPDLLQRARPGMDDVAFRRARHVVTENERVLATVAALEIGDLAAVGPLFAASHASLSDDYEVSTPELDRLVEIAASTPGVIGARLTGAGFGGCTINIVAPASVAELEARLHDAYRAPDGSPARVLRVRAANGAGPIQLAPR